MVGAVLWGWIFGVERRVLAFTPAEVTFLFSGPVPRRGLVQYKLLRNQLLILFNSLLWTLILSRERFGASPWLRALSIWVLLTTLSFHRLGASFVRTSLLEHGRIALRHRVVSLVVLGAGVIGIALERRRTRCPTLAAGWAAGPDAVPGRARRGGGRSRCRGRLLAPFRAMVRPLAAHSFAEWVQAMGPALLLLALHYIWVIRADTAFEEAAAEASLLRARQVSARGGASASPSLAHRRLPPLFQPGAGRLARRRPPLEEPARRRAHAARTEHGRGALSSARSPRPRSRSRATARWRRSPAGWRRPGPRSRS